MRESDQILYDDLMAAGLSDMALRAARSEWNDYFSRHHSPITHLREALRYQASKLPEGSRRRIAIENMRDRAASGAYDGTQAESLEWQGTEEGQRAAAALLGLEPKQ